MSLAACSDLGVHIDGYIAVVAHTTIVAADPATPVPTVTGPQADVFAAAYAAAEAAAKTIKPGNTVWPVFKHFEVYVPHAHRTHSLHGTAEHASDGGDQAGR